MSRGWVPYVVLGSGTATAMWAVGYLCRFPGVPVPNVVLFLLLLILLLIGGMIGARTLRPGARTGAVIGLIAGLINLLIVGSLLTESSTPAEGGGAIVPSALIWIPGSLIASAAMGAAGALFSRSGAAAMTWSPSTSMSAMLGVALAATLLVLIAGGLVTSAEAGLAVPDWPTSFGSNMFLYPLSRMTGGIYLEHAHRLYGTLVGLTTILVAVTAFAVEKRRSFIWACVTLVLLVSVQGYLGGKRVVDPSTSMAALHGVLGQLIFAMVGVLFIMATSAWQNAAGVTSRLVKSDVTLARVALLLLVGQLFFGALYRHTFTPEKPMPWPAHAHLTLAAIVIVVVVMASLRGAARQERGVGRSIAKAMMHTLGAQIILGIAALVAVLTQDGSPLPWQVGLATAHQANGALLLACSAMHAAWVSRAAKS